MIGLEVSYRFKCSVYGGFDGVVSVQVTPESDADDFIASELIFE